MIIVADPTHTGDTVHNSMGFFQAPLASHCVEDNKRAFHGVEAALQH